QARDGARLPDARDYADPSVDGHRCLLHRRARALAPLLRDPRPLPHQRADPRPAAAGRRGDGADPQRLHGALRRARRGRPLARLPGPRTAVRLLRGGPPMTADRRSVTLRWLFLAPTMLGVGVFVVVPIVGSLVLAFFRWDIITAPSSWAWRTSRTSPPTAASASPSPTPPCSWSSRCSPSSPSPCCWPCSCRGGCPAGCGSSSVRPSSSRWCSPPRASPS